MCDQNFDIRFHNFAFRASYHGKQQNGRTGMRLGHIAGTDRQYENTYMYMYTLHIQCTNVQTCV